MLLSVFGVCEGTQITGMIMKQMECWYEEGRTRGAGELRKVSGGERGEEEGEGGDKKKKGP